MGSSFAGNVQAPQSLNAAPFTSEGFGGALNNTWGLSSNYSGLGPSVLPQAQTTANNLYNNPYAGQAQAGANAAAPLGTSAAYSSFNTGAGLVPYAQQILNTGFDPQNALYNQMYQQTIDQSNVNNAQAGVANTPYGAGVTNQAATNFNIDWQNNLLNRQATAAGAALPLATTGTSLMSQAPSQLVQSATIPYATYTDIGQGQDTALSQLLGIGTSGANLSNIPISDFLQIAGAGNQADNVNNQLYQNQLNQSQLGWKQMAQLGQGIGNLFGNFL